MKPIIFILFSLIFGCPGMVSAELYKYYNQNGTLCFTDDVSMVPADQRPAVETIHEIQTKQIIPVPPVTDAVTKPIDQTIHNKADLKSELDMEFKQLEMVKKNLSDDYLALKERRDLLILNGKRKMNTKEIKAYNREANKLSQDTLKYKEKQQAFFKKVEAYNLKLESVQ